MRWLPLVVLWVAVSACRTRCETGFLERNGACVAFGVDAGQPREDASMGPPDSGPRLDATVSDAGFRDALVHLDAQVRPDLGFSDDAATESVTAGEPNKLLLRASAVLPMTSEAVITAGEVYVEDRFIRCVGARGSCAAEGATVIELNGILIPGLVDAHNHVAYNWLPEWESGRLWSDSQQWRGSSAYDQYIDPYSANSGTLERFCAMAQWGEIKALVHGTTTIFGLPQPRTCFRWLIRNAELSSAYNGWDADVVRSNTLGIDTVSAEAAATLIGDMEAGLVGAYMIHLSEGISERSLMEFTTLTELGLLREETVIIHGTAMGAKEFQMAANVGAKLVWSPSSNLALYGQTTDVGTAIAAGISVSVAPDWTPSGTDVPLAELRVARTVADTLWPNLLDDADLLAMATLVPAAQMAVDNDVGSLEPGKYADMVLLDLPAASPFEAVLEARPQDFKLIVLDGKVVYGAPEWLALLPKPASCHQVDACGAPKTLCFDEPPTGPISPEGLATAIQGFYPPGPLALFACDQ